MCGICGKVNLGSDAPPVTSESLRNMMEVISHRGPDADGVYVAGPVGLGHKRLKIIDLITGKQPMCNEDKTVWVTFNGEIYNYKELAAGLVRKGHRFKSTSDTEVIVHLYEELGEECVKHFRGMFSFALWDDRKKLLLLARDRVGIKPLYYMRTANSLLFASEIKSILTDSAAKAELEPAMIDRFLTYFYMPGEQTLFKSVNKLQPGCYLTVNKGNIKITPYWDLTFSRVDRGFDSAVEELDHLLSETVRDHMISDVPVGVLLSGGVDSGGVLSYAAEHSHRPISAFTIGFDQGHMDERPAARRAAEAFGAHFYHTSITARQFWDLIPKYVWHMEEPVCEPPAIALFWVSKLAREHVTVLLSGEGSDEAFGGYQSYRNIRLIEKFKGMLGPFAHGAGSAVSACLRDDSRYGKYGSFMRTPLEDYYFSHGSGPYEFPNSHFRELYTPEFLAMIDCERRSECSRSHFAQASALDPLDQMLYVDTKTWLPDDLLIKADRMTMANSLELRVPFLDHRILEFAASLPPAYKVKNLTGKYILKKALSRRLPAEIVKRKKAGFPVPYTSWLYKELQGSVSEVLLDDSTIARGYFRKDTVEKIIRGGPRRNWSKEIFSLVVLEFWHRMFVDTVPEARKHLSDDYVSV